ncbi:MAG: MFS transporter, partial [Myxococcales bacterium]
LSGFSFALVYITAGIPIAYWADRGNRRNIIVLAVTVWSGMTALSGFARSFSELLLARIGVGIGEAGGSPPAHSMISDYYPPKERATALGIYSTGVHIGVLLGFLAGGFIAQEMGWRVAFMAVGLPGILFAAVMYFTVREPERGRWETAEEAQYTPTLRETIDLLMKFRSFWFLAMGCGLTAFAGYGNGNFTPPFLMRSHGLEVGEVGVLLAVFGGGGGIIGTLLGGKLADHLGAKDARWYMWVPAIAGILALPLTFPYLLLDNTTVVMGLLFVVTILINTYLGPCIAMAHALVPPAMRSLTSAILFFVLNLIGLGMGPLTAGVLSDYFSQTYGDDGLRYAMLIVGMVASVGILMFFMAARTIRADLEAARALTHT